MPMPVQTASEHHVTGRDAAEMRVLETAAPVSSVHRPVQHQASFKPPNECFTARTYASPLFLKYIQSKLLNSINYGDTLLIFVTASQLKLSCYIAINITEVMKPGGHGCARGCPSKAARTAERWRERGEQGLPWPPAHGPLLLPGLAGGKAFHVPEGIICVTLQATDFCHLVPLQTSAIPSPAVLCSWG